MKSFHRLLPIVTIGIASGLAVYCKSGAARFNDVSISSPVWKQSIRRFGAISIALFWIDRDPGTKNEIVYRGRCTDSSPAFADDVAIPSKRWSRENCKDSVDAVNLEDFKKSFQDVAQRLVYTDTEQERVLLIKQLLEQRKKLSLQLESLGELLKESKTPATSMFPTMIEHTKLEIADIDSSMKELNGGFDDLQLKLASAIQALEFVEREMREKAPIYELNPDSFSKSPMLALVADIVARAFAEAANFRERGGKVGQASNANLSNLDADFESIARENTLKLHFKRQQLTILSVQEKSQIPLWYFVDLRGVDLGTRLVLHRDYRHWVRPVPGTEVLSVGKSLNDGYLQQEMLDVLEKDQFPACQLSLSEPRTPFDRTNPPLLDGTYLWRGGLDPVWPLMRFEREGIAGDGSASEDAFFLQCGFVTYVSTEQRPQMLRAPKRIFMGLTISEERTDSRRDLATDIRLDWRTALRLLRIIDPDFTKNNGMTE